MDTLTLLVTEHSDAIPALLTDRERQERTTFIVVFVTAVLLAPLMVLMSDRLGFTIFLVVAVGCILGMLVIRWPVVGFYTAAACAVLIEEQPIATDIFTDRLHVYTWPASLQGLIERPIGFLFLFILVVLVFHRLMKREQPLQGGPLLLPFLLFLLCVGVGVVHGLASGSDLKLIVIEVRPFWYLFITYLLGYNLVANVRHVRVFCWIIILGAGVKALQGLYIVVVALQGHVSGQNEIMAPEDSFFFIALLLLVALFAIHHRNRAQFYTALVLVPFVLVSLIANNRRADYLALVLGLAAACTLVLIVKPEVRAVLVPTLVFFAIVGGAYVVAFSRSEGAFAAPAHAIISTIAPDPTDQRDVQSNLYRNTENYDLKYTVKRDPLVGEGFGRPFLQPIPLPDISLSDPIYLVVPHNTIYWVLLRLGAIGYLVFWYLIGAIVVRGTHIVRQLRDPYLQLVAIFVVGVTFMEVIVAYADYQLFFYRNVIYMGLLIGMLMRLPALDEAQEISSQ